MKTYLIHSYEDIYGGLHGMESWLIVECDNQKEAYDIGFDEALDVINSYSEIYEKIEEEIETEYDSIDENEKEELIYDRMKEYACVDIWRLQDNIDYYAVENEYYGMPDYKEILKKYGTEDND